MSCERGETEAVTLLPWVKSSALFLRPREVFTERLLCTWGTCSCSNSVTTSCMFGLNLDSVARHCRERVATLKASSISYWPSRRLSNTRKSFLLFAMYGFAHSTKLCCPDGLFLSTALLPDNSSSSTTPKLNTSLLALTWPSPTYTLVNHQNHIQNEFRSACAQPKWM